MIQLLSYFSYHLKVLIKVTSQFFTVGCNLQTAFARGTLYNVQVVKWRKNWLRETWCNNPAAMSNGNFFSNKSFENEIQIMFDLSLIKNSITRHQVMEDNIDDVIMPACLKGIDKVAEGFCINDFQLSRNSYNSLSSSLLLSLKPKFCLDD